MRTQMTFSMKSFSKACIICGSRVSTNSRSKKCGRCVRVKACYALSSCALTKTSFYNADIVLLESFHRLLCISMRLAHQLCNLGARMFLDEFL